jgi:hypothetical protein
MLKKRNHAQQWHPQFHLLGTVAVYDFTKADMLNPGLDGDEWATLTVEERIARCRAYARQAARFAQDVHPDRKQAYLDIADQWNALAAEIAPASR